ncbi:PREDICTED: tyrosine-protein kinase Mer-like, partial [Tinamus guttatus]|uniref:tyrosine-protein kinase Mer-like n=1 Tax=Tinamus guttatus TaxID=94827 RepID=UPI00052ED95A
MSSLQTSKDTRGNNPDQDKEEFLRPACPLVTLCHLAHVMQQGGNPAVLHGDVEAGMPWANCAESSGDPQPRGKSHGFGNKGLVLQGLYVVKAVVAGLQPGLWRGNVPPKALRQINPEECGCLSLPIPEMDARVPAQGTLLSRAAGRNRGLRPSLSLSAEVVPAESHRAKRDLSPLGHRPHQSAKQPQEEPAASSLGQVKFNPTVGHIVINEHKDVTFNCSIKVPHRLARPDAPGISLWKDGRELHALDRIATSHFEISDEDEVAMTSTFSIHAAQRSDNGSYVCKLNVSDVEIVSDPIFVQLEGLPHFIRQPEKLNVTKNSPFNLTCQAVGPPEPVEIYWFRNNIRVNAKPHVSPSVLTVPGLNETALFSCEAHNRIPSAPTSVHVLNRTAHSIAVSWVPGFDAFSAFNNCSVQ